MLNSIPVYSRLIGWLIVKYDLLLLSAESAFAELTCYGFYSVTGQVLVAVADLPIFATLHRSPSARQVPSGSAWQKHCKCQVFCSKKVPGCPDIHFDSPAIFGLREKNS